MVLSQVVLLRNSSCKKLFSHPSERLNLRTEVAFSTSLVEDAVSGVGIQVVITVNFKISVLDPPDGLSDPEVFASDFDFGIGLSGEDGEVVEKDVSGPDLIVLAWPVMREAIIGKCREYDIKAPSLPFSVSPDIISMPAPIE